MKVENYNEFIKRKILEERLTNILNYNSKNNYELLQMKMYEKKLYNRLKRFIGKRNLKTLEEYIEIVNKNITYEFTLVIQQLIEDLI